MGLLTAKTRLPSFSDGWEVKRLGEVFAISSGTSKSDHIVSGGRYWIADMGSVGRDGRLIVSKATNWRGDFLKLGDLVMPKDDIGGGNVIGTVGYIDADDTYVLGDHVYCLRANVGDPLFLSYAINSYRTNSALRRKVGSARPNWSWQKSVAEQEICFSPSTTEQTTIARVLYGFGCGDHHAGAEARKGQKPQAGYDPRTAHWQSTVRMRDAEPFTMFFVGWDVGGWNCDGNNKSRDAIVILDETRAIVGKPWRRNLRTQINAADSTRIRRFRHCSGYALPKQLTHLRTSIWRSTRRSAFLMHLLNW